MHLVNRTSITRGGGFGPLPGFFIVLVFFSFFNSPVSAATKHEIKLIYFFSTTCIHCSEARPAILELSKEFSIEGMQFGEGHPSYPFPVKPGDKEVAKEVYHVPGVPTLIVLVDGKNTLTVAGTNEIRDAAVIIRALASGALTASDAALVKQNEPITVTGWILARGTSFKDVHYFLSDHKSELPVKAWLPIEAVKSPFRKKPPRLMSDVIRKPVVLQGSVEKTTAGILFLVKKELHD